MHKDLTVKHQQQTTIDHVRERFEFWRKSRVKQCPIPDALWDAAVQLHGEYTICRISKVLRLNYMDLKRRIFNTSEKGIDLPPAFIQLDLPRPSTLTEWSIEMENIEGAKMKISAKSCQLPDLKQLSQSFLGGCR